MPRCWPPSTWAARSRTRSLPGTSPRSGRSLHPEIEFRALTPRRAWEADDPESGAARHADGFDGAELEQVIAVETDAYRFRGRRPAGPFVIEQQVYLGERGGRIDWMGILCSGFRPPGPA